MITALTCLLMSAQPVWEEAARENGITVLARDFPGSEVREMKAVGLIDGSPDEVWKVIRDYPSFTTTMPYTVDARVLDREDGDRVVYFYSRLDLPLVANRDYVIKLVDESDWQEGKGYLKVRWTRADAPLGDKRHVPEKADVVRVQENEGFWRLEPRENGKKTWATYYLHTDPGGSVPKWICNRVNSTAVPSVFEAIRKVVAGARAKGRPE